MIMIRIYVIDNGGQWTHREWRTLRDIDVDTKIVPNTTPFKEISAENVDGLVLSGGAPRIGLQKDLGNCREYLEKANFPILGICAGHQFIAKFFGGIVAPSKIPEFGKMLGHCDNIRIYFLESPVEVCIHCLFIPAASKNYIEKC